MSSKRKIISIDPGYDICGYSLLNLDVNTRDIELIVAGAIRTPADIRYEKRLVMLEDDFMLLLDQLQPEVAAIENMYVDKGFENVLLVAQARGILLKCLTRYGIIPQAFSPVQVKFAVTGNGRAKKPEVQDAVKKYFNLSSRIEPDDASDAVAIGLTYAFRIQ